MNVDAIVTAARAQAHEDIPVIAFADFRYLEVLLNWLVGLATCGIKNYLVVALDRALNGYLEERGVPVALSELDGDLTALWLKRIDIFQGLCAAGVDFIHSDVDAIWMRDPRPCHFGDLSIDLVVSQGTIWPPDVHAQFGFVLCCGLFQLRSNIRTQRLLDDLKAHVKDTGDDQISLNRVIASRSMRWRIESGTAYRVELAGKHLFCSRAGVVGTGSDGLRVCLLPQHLFQRIPLHSNEPPYVLHLLTPKTANAKLRQFEKHRCRLLRPDWQSIHFDAGSLLRLRRGDWSSA